MESLLVALNVVFPLIILIAIGYMAGALRWVSGESFSQMNALVFKVLLPCLLFDNVCSVSLDASIDAKQIAFGICAVVLIFAFGAPLAAALTSEPEKRGVALQSMFRSNFVLYGLPIVQSIYPKEKLAPATVMIAVVVPVFNVLAVVALEMFRRGRVNAVKIAANIVKNPLIIATALGLLFAAVKLDVPQILRGPLTGLSGAATPMALIILGGTFRQQTLNENKKLLTALCALRLLIVPAIFTCAAILFGFRDVELLTFVALFGSPVAVSSFSMAKQMGADSELAGQNLLITTVFSVFTIFAWVSLLSFFSFITV